MRSEHPPFVSQILTALAGDESAELAAQLSANDDHDVPAWFNVSDLAAASIGAAGVMLTRLHDQPGTLSVSKRLAGLWFGTSLRPIGWEVPPLWDRLAGDYRTRDGWIRLHTNATHHRAAALSVLGQYDDRAALAAAVAAWDGEALESAVVGAGGCAAVMRSLADWACHPQGRAVAKEPLVHWQCLNTVATQRRKISPGVPLAGIRVLDLTRVLAGPVATRFLAGFGADVLRVDPMDWDEPGVIPEVTLGKRCAGLDLKSNAGRVVFETLLRSCDVLMHGYRPGALADLGYSREALSILNPALIDVSLLAYGATGPWHARRGFDSLVQMSSGIADFGMTREAAADPVPLPVQALDHATGYLMAGAALQGLFELHRSGRVLSAHLSLARTAHLLCQSKRAAIHPNALSEAGSDMSTDIENTPWGPARRIKFPLSFETFSPHWPNGAARLRSSPAQWLPR